MCSSDSRPALAIPLLTRSLALSPKNIGTENLLATEAPKAPFSNAFFTTIIPSLDAPVANPFNGIAAIPGANPTR